jgi:hypothetical protein
MVDCVRYEHGTLKMSYHENITTGDREGVRYEGNAEIVEVVDPLLEGIDNLLAQPYDFKEMPIRSGLKGKDVVLVATLGRNFFTPIAEDTETTESTSQQSKSEEQSDPTQESITAELESSNEDQSANS